LSFNSANNQISTSGYSYDLAGNLLTDNTHGYVYDGENRITCVRGTDGTCTSPSAVLYFYDPEGQRVGKHQGDAMEDYVYDTQGHISSVHDGSTNLVRSEFYAPDGRHVATLDGSTLTGNLYWNHADWLGTERVRTTLTNGTVTIAETCTDTPYGMNLGCNPTEISPMHFTGKQRDYETNLDYFGARYFGGGNNLGRFMTPDPFGGSLSDPQTLNRYAYVRNNPTTLTDPAGLSASFGGCTLNGATVPCGIAFGAVNSGSAVQCPDNNCNGVMATAVGTYQRVPSSFSQSGGVMSITIGYWALVSPEALGFFGKLRWYVNGAVDSVRDWVARQLTPPPGVSYGIIPPQALGGMLGPEDSWGDPATLEQHWWDHGEDFGIKSPSEYAQEASDFLVRSQAEGLPTKIDSDGTIYVYERSTNTLGIYNADGTTKSFYAPERAGRYFADQPGTIVPKP
jgi:RHS repeat-associated protein